MAILPSDAKDLLTCIAFSPSSPTQLATSSLDGFVRVYARESTDNTWTERSKWRAHEGPVLKLAWAPRLWAGVLATGGAEGGIRIWERCDAASRPSTSKDSKEASSAPSSVEWAERASLVESRAPIRDLAFAPASSSSPLILASLAADSILRIYTLGPSGTQASIGPSYSAFSSPLSSWSLSHHLDITRLPSTPSTSSVPSVQKHSFPSGNLGDTSNGGWCLGWCRELTYGLILAVSAGDQDLVRILRVESFGEPVQELVLQAPTPSSTSNLADTGTTSNNKSGVKPQPTPSSFGASGTASPGTPGMGGFGSPWSNDTPTPTSAPGFGGAFSTSPSNTGAAFQGGHSRNQTGPSNLTARSNLQYPFGGVVSLDWAPPQGRSFQLIATASREDHVRIWKVLLPPPSHGNNLTRPVVENLTKSLDANNPSVAPGEWRAQLVADLSHTGASSGKVEWNVTGTVLASAADDGLTKLWKSTFSGEWKCVGVVSGQGNDEEIKE